MELFKKFLALKNSLLQKIRNISIKFFSNFCDRLHSGLVGLLFDNLENIIFTAEEVKTLRKNILLYQLKQGTPNKVVQCMQNISQLKLDEVDLNNQISKLEEEYEQLDFIVRQKGMLVG